MICIDNTCTDIYFNLAAEEVLLKNYRDDVFMLWQSDKAVVVGKHQDIMAEINYPFVSKHNIAIARRYTGGGSVYHDPGNINLTFIKNTNDLDFSQYTKKIIDFLTSVGIKANTDERLGIRIDNLKISGSAQGIYKDRTLYHCTLLYSCDLEILKTSLNTNPTITPGFKYPSSVKSVKSKVTNIREHLFDPLPISGFKQLLFSYFTDQAGGIHYSFTQQDIQAIDQLKNEKYIQTDWITASSNKIPVNNP